MNDPDGKMNDRHRRNRPWLNQGEDPERMMSRLAWESHVKHVNAEQRLRVTRMRETQQLYRQTYGDLPKNSTAQWAWARRSRPWGADGRPVPGPLPGPSSKPIVEKSVIQPLDRQLDPTAPQS